MVEKIYHTVRDEFGEFDRTLLDKPEIILLTKVDLLDKKNLDKKIKLLKKLKKPVYPISIYDENSLNALKDAIWQIQKV